MSLPPWLSAFRCFPPNMPALSPPIALRFLPFSVSLIRNIENTAESHHALFARVNLGGRLYVVVKSWIRIYILSMVNQVKWRCVADGRHRLPGAAHGTQPGITVSMVWQKRHQNQRTKDSVYHSWLATKHATSPSCQHQIYGCRCCRFPHCRQPGCHIRPEYDFYHSCRQCGTAMHRHALRTVPQQAQSATVNSADTHIGAGHLPHPVLSGGVRRVQRHPDEAYSEAAELRRPCFIWTEEI